MEDQLHHNILYSCTYDIKRSTEQIVPEHVLAYVISGSIEFYTASGIKKFPAGSAGIIRKNYLARATKYPDADGKPAETINIFLLQKTLHKYALEKGINEQPRYFGDDMINLSDNDFIKGYFQSLRPYFSNPKSINESLAELKTKEAIELLLQHQSQLQTLLFDFNEPFKLDLEQYMVQNYIFNIPIKEFARLTGRSLSTFKRDFKRIFDNTPEKWLRKKRLEKAHYLITVEKQKPSDTYLQVGFENFSHFSTSFKEQFGYSASSL